MNHSNQENGKPVSAAQRTFFLKSTFARLLTVILLGGGVLAATNMVKETDPDLAIAAATISTEWPGGDSQTIEQQVTNKLEKKLKNLKGLKRLMSGSFSGFSLISVEFEAGIEAKEALARLRAKVNEAQGDLPSDAKKPVVAQVSISDKPIYSIRLYGDAEIGVLSAWAKKLKKNLEQVGGVNKAKILGNRDEIVSVQVIGARAAALGVSPIDISDTIQEANVDMPWGSFDGEAFGVQMRLVGRFRDIEQLKNLIVKRYADRVVRLSEVAIVQRALDQEKVRTYFSEKGSEYKRSVAIAVTKQPGADAIEVIERISDVLEAEAKKNSWPKSVRYAVVVDESINIIDQLSNVASNGVQAVIAVFIILLVSLTWREALIAGLAIPIAFAGGLLAVALMGYSLNQIVMIGMVVALGLKVDAFILMMEGMHENMFVEKKSFKDSALATVRTYAIPALSGQMTTIAAMIPLLAIAGTVGKYIRPMPMTAISCLVASYIVALLITIPLSRYVLPKKGTVVQKTKIDHLSEIASNKLASSLRSLFVVSRKHAAAWVAVSVALLFGSAFLVQDLPIELMPKSDGRNLGVFIELESNTSLASSQQCADKVGERLRQLPYLESVTKQVGEKSPFSTPGLVDQMSPKKSLGYVGFTVVFSLRDEREKLAYEYVPEIERTISEAMDACPGGILLMTPSVGGATSEPPIQIQIIGDDVKTLRRLAENVVSEMKEIPGTASVRHNLGAPALELQAKPRPEALNFYGIDNQELATQIRTLMANDKVGNFVRGGVEEDLDIKMSYLWPNRKGEIGGPVYIDEAYVLNVINHLERSIPLLSLVDLSFDQAAQSILHVGGKRTVTIFADTDRRTADQILNDLKPTLDNMQQEWPSGYGYKFAGEAETSEEVFGSAGTMLMIALFLVFALLVLQFDSFTQPIIIILTIPLAITGTFFGFFALQSPFSFMTMVGLIALIGIVVNDSIVMCETMNNYLKQGVDVREAAARGGADRLRPILTTSITTIAGMLPLAISDPMWFPLGLTVISGLVFATVLALLIVPCLYLLLTPKSAYNEDL